MIAKEKIGNQVMLNSSTVTSIFLTSVLCGISLYGLAQQDSSSIRFDSISDDRHVDTRVTVDVRVSAV